MPASAALAAARRYIAGPLADYRAKLDAWNAEPDKRRYAPGGIANRPTMPEFYREPRGLALQRGPCEMDSSPLRPGARVRWRYYLAAALVVALAGCQRSPVVAGDFACALDGGDTLLIEDVAAATALHSGAWRVDVEAGFYLYAPRAGELCAVLP